jgi:ketosteroid isomerase-like protein
MSALEEVRELNQRIVAAASKGDLAPFAGALDEEVQVFDHVAYLFENKATFLEYLQSAMGGAASMTYTMHQCVYHLITDTAVVVNAYDRMQVTPRTGGEVRVQSGRTTLVYGKKDRDWKIASAHFSPLPKD